MEPTIVSARLTGINGNTAQLHITFGTQIGVEFHEEGSHTINRRDVFNEERIEILTGMYGKIVEVALGVVRDRSVSYIKVKENEMMVYYIDPVARNIKLFLTDTYGQVRFV
jgi:hypothetical protein